MSRVLSRKQAHEARYDPTARDDAYLLTPEEQRAILLRNVDLVWSRLHSVKRTAEVLGITLAEVQRCLYLLNLDTPGVPPPADTPDRPEGRTPH